jgi:hypothetical protein
MLLFLSDVPPGEGGLTVLPLVGVSVRPQKGKLLLLENLDEQDLCNTLSAYGSGEIVAPRSIDGMPGAATGDGKYVLRKLVYAEPYDNRRAHDAYRTGRILCTQTSCRRYDRAAGA